eukprot:UN24961
MTDTYEGCKPDYRFMQNFLRNSKKLRLKSDLTWLCRNSNGIYYVIEEIKIPTTPEYNVAEASDKKKNEIENLRKEIESRNSSESKQQHWETCLSTLGCAFELIILNFESMSLRMGVDKFDIIGYNWEDVVHTFNNCRDKKKGGTTQFSDWTFFGDDQAMHSGTEYLSYLYTKQEKRHICITGKKNEMDRSRYFKAYDPNARHFSSNLSLEDLDPEYLLDNATYFKSLKKYSKMEDKSHRIKLYNQYEKLFDKWLLWLLFGHNLLCYGLGSKKKLLQDFLTTRCSYGHCFIVNGYHPLTKLTELIRGLCHKLGLKLKPGNNNVREQILGLGEALKKDKKRRSIFILFNNIDGQALRTGQCQEQLSRLSLIPNIHIVASIDHLNAMSIWDPQLEARFCWRRIHILTYEPYDLETHFDQEKIV